MFIETNVLMRQSPQEKLRKLNGPRGIPSRSVVGRADDCDAVDGRLAKIILTNSNQVIFGYIHQLLAMGGELLLAAASAFAFRAQGLARGLAGSPAPAAARRPAQGLRQLARRIRSALRRAST